MLLDDKINQIRKDFSYLNENKVGKKIVYLDNAATSQKPNQVIDAISNYYKYQNANPHRGAHYLTVKATEIYEDAREKVAKFINAKDESQIIFTRNATESFNLIAYSYALNNLKKDDEILITILEHHSNFVPWQYVCQKTGAKLKIVYLDDDFSIDINDYQNKLNNKTKIVSFTGASNVTSYISPIKEMIKMAHNVNAITIVDASQLVPHKKIDVLDYDCDFLAFSGHKMLAPMGTGVLYSKYKLLDEMSPFLYGGDMIEYVQEQTSTYAQLPHKFEAGTMNVGSIAGLSVAIDYLQEIGMDNVFERESQLTKYALENLRKIPYVDVYYPKNKNENFASAISFNIKQVHAHDVASIFDFYNIAVRSGHHCTMPLHKYLNINSTCRASIAFYNTKDEIDEFLNRFDDVRRTLGWN